MLVKKVRPREVKSTTKQVKTGCGSLYVTVGFNSNEPIEVFATLGKAGGCSNCQNEALGRAISLGLKYGVPVKEYVEELKGLRCPNPNMWPKEEKCLSCADGIAKAMEGYVRDEEVGILKGGTNGKMG